MSIHFFNPSHDMSLASGEKNFCAPANIRKMQEDLSVLPLWKARCGDKIMVSSPALATSWAQECMLVPEGVEFISENSPYGGEEITPWGWDAAMCHLIDRWARRTSEHIKAPVPSANEIDAIRLLSHRRVSAEILDELVSKNSDIFTGKAWECLSLNEIINIMAREGKLMLKAPWSCSGRGLHPLDRDTCTPSLEGWISKIIRTQKSIMAEPLHERISDFAMEFHIDDKGICYDGLSCFLTGQTGSYEGNLIASQEIISRRITGSFSTSHEEGKKVLEYLRDSLLHTLWQKLAGRYRGELGIDMMTVMTPHGVRIVPCVEMNLRCTMGHMALHLSRLIREGEAAIYRTLCFPQGWRLREHLQGKGQAMTGDRKLCSGILALTPVTETTCFVATLEHIGQECCW